MHSSRPISTIYPPLQGDGSFRLIQLEPGLRDDPIIVTLGTVASLDSVEYDALSYVWGDHKNTRTITCNQHEISITANLFWALHRVREPFSAKYIWTDALCIDQADKDELSAQVALMGQIYSQANVVYICMGECPGDDDVVIEGLIARALHYVRGEKFWGTYTGYDITTDPSWLAMARLDGNPWFQRAWVLQEAGLARNPIVLYGDVEFNYRDLIRTLQWRGHHAWSYHFGGQNWAVHPTWIDWSQPPTDSNLTVLDLLSHSCYLKCSDPRDHVYAFLGHPFAQKADGTGPIVRPDYGKDVVDVYTEVTQSLLRDYGLRVLSMVEHNAHTIEEDAPSWTLRWDAFEIVNDIDNTHRRSNASPGLSASCEFEGRCLVARGVVLDTVDEVLNCEAQDGMLMFLKGVTAVTLKQLMETLSSMYGDQSLEVLGKTLVADLFDYAPHVLLRNLEALANNTHAHHARTKTEREEIMAYRELLSTFVKGRCLAITRNGNLALAPKITRAGDVVCVLFGAKVPVVLRPARSQYRLLGETYMHGFMHGEMKDMLTRGILVEESIILH